MEELIAKLGIPGSIAVVIVFIFVLLQVIGMFIDASNKVVNFFMPIGKRIRSSWKKKQEQEQILAEVKQLLTDVNGHYSADNIAKRDSWMTWVNDRAIVYDNTIVEYKEALDGIRDALNNNTKMTEQMFVENSRDRIIDFASKITDPLHECHVSREEFHRIFKVYEKYETFLDEHNMTNGEVEINYQIIRDEYAKRQHSHKFTEDIRNM